MSKASEQRKEKMREYYQRPEVKERRRRAARERYATDPVAREKQKALSTDYYHRVAKHSPRPYNNHRPLKRPSTNGYDCPAGPCLECVLPDCMVPTGSDRLKPHWVEVARRLKAERDAG